MPFPWTRNGNCKRPAPEYPGADTAKIVRSHGMVQEHEVTKPLQINPWPKRGTDLNRMNLCIQPWFSNLVLPCDKMGCISFNVTQSGVPAGRVLQHALRVLDGLFAKYAPLIFKIGFTHNPAWRWGNDLYGYKKAQDGWTDMIVLYVSNEHYSPAMLEAALIDKHRSNSLAVIFGHDVSLTYPFFKSILRIPG